MAEKINIPTKWLNTEEAAHYCRMSIASLHKAASKGIGPRSRRKRGAPTIYNIEWLDEWLEFQAKRGDWQVWADYQACWQRGWVDSFKEFEEALTNKGTTQ